MSKKKEKNKPVELPGVTNKMACVPETPRYIRLPKEGSICPWSSLSRGKLNSLILASKAQPIPPVKSIVIPNTFANKKGCRLIVLSSLMDYLKKLEDEQS